LTINLSINSSSLSFIINFLKARIKAILAQAALQAAANSGYPLGGSDLSGALGSLGLNASLNALGNYTNALNNGNANGSGMDDVVMMNGQLMSQQMKSAASLFSHGSSSNSHSSSGSGGSSGVGVSDAATYAAFYKNIEPSSPTSTSGGANSSLPNTFFNPDQLIKFAKGSNSSSSGASSSDTDAQANKEASNSAYSSFSLEIESDFKDFKDLERNLLENVKENNSNKSGSSGASGKKEPKLSNSSEEIILTLTKKALSPTSSNSPHYHDCLSVSSDSGCRSASFLNDEDSAIASLKSIEHFSRHLKLKEQEKQQQQQQQSNGKSSTLKPESSVTTSDLTISEHCEYTCSNSSPVKSSAKNGGNNCMLLDLVEIENDAVAGLGNCGWNYLSFQKFCLKLFNFLFQLKSKPWQIMRPKKPTTLTVTATVTRPMTHPKYQLTPTA